MRKMHGETTLKGNVCLLGRLSVVAETNGNLSCAATPDGSGGSNTAWHCNTVHASPTINMLNTGSNIDRQTTQQHCVFHQTHVKLLETDRVQGFTEKNLKWT